MKRMFLPAFFVLYSSVATAGNFATCLLDDLPGVQSDVAAYAITRVCKDRYPLVFLDVEQGSGRGIFGYDSGPECAAKLAAKTPSQIAGQFIYRACNLLYNKPAFNPFDQFDTESSGK